MRVRRVPGRWSGQRKLARDGVTAAYPFGFGLGYTTFELCELRVDPAAGERFNVTVTVVDTGGRAGRHVAQIYARYRADGGKPVRAMVGFRSLRIEAGHARELTFACATRPLERWTGGGFVLAAQEVSFEAAYYAGDPDAIVTVVTLPGWSGGPCSN